MRPRLLLACLVGLALVAVAFTLGVWTGRASTPPPEGPASPSASAPATVLGPRLILDAGVSLLPDASLRVGFPDPPVVPAR